MAEEPATKKQKTSRGLDVASLDNPVIFRCYYCKKEIPPSELRVVRNNYWYAKPLQMIFHLTCIRDYFVNLLSINLQRLYAVDEEEQNARDDKSRSSSSKSTNNT